MDFYLDFMRTMEKSHDPEITLCELTEMVKGIIGQAPARVALAEGTALLAVIHDYANPKAIQTLPAFRDLTESVELLLTALDVDLDLEEHMWDEEGKCGNLSRHVVDLDSESEGLSRHFLDFEGVEAWGKARWAAFAVQVDAAIDIAATSPAGVDSMTHLLTEIRKNFDRIPVDNQEQALVAADKLILAVRENMEYMMDTMQDKHQIELMTDMGDWDGEDNPAVDLSENPPDADESAAVFTSMQQPYLDLTGWENWSEDDWRIFAQAVADAQAAATTEPADPVPAIQLFLSIRQNIGTLELHRKFSMGNTADDLMEAVKKGMAQDLFQIQKKCPFAPRPVEVVAPPSKDSDQIPTQCAVSPAFDLNDKRWKKGQVGRETVELNFDRLAEWNLSHWAALRIHADKLTAAAEMTTDALGQPGQLLEDIRAHIQQIPQHYMEDVSQMTIQLANAITEKVSGTMAEILRYCGQGEYR